MQRPQLFTRKKLNELLDSAWDKQMIFLTAPMGYGKTTAVSEYLKARAFDNVEWIRFSEYENNEVVFLKHINQVFQNNGIVIDVQTQRNLPDLNYFELLNYVNLLKEGIKKETVIVLEDYHLCNVSRISKIIEIVGEVGIPELHLIVVGRYYTDIPYIEMQMKGICELIEKKDIRLSEEEIAEFFAQNGCKLSKEDVSKVRKFTEGWMAAVYLLCLDTMQGMPMSGEHSVNLLIKTSVFQKLSPEEQNILMELHLLTSFTSDWANFLTDNVNASTILLDLSRRIGFIQYSERTGFEIHALLRSVAAQEAISHGFQRKEFIQKMIRLCIREEKYTAVIRCYAELEQYGSMFSVFRQYDMSKVYQDDMPTLYEVYKKVPFDKKCAHLEIYLEFVIQYATFMSYSKGMKLYEEIKEYCAGVTSEREGDVVLCQIAMLEMLSHFNHTDRMQKAISVPLSRMSYQTMLPLQQEIAKVYAVPSVIRLIHYKRGNIKKSIQDYEMFMLQSGWGQDDTYQNVISVLEMEYLYETGNIEPALQEAEILVKKFQVSKDPIHLIYAYRVFFSCCLMLGKAKEVKQELTFLEEYLKQFDWPWLQADFKLLRVEIMCGLLYIQGENNEEDMFVKLKYNRIVRHSGLAQVLYGKQLISRRKYDELEMVALEMLRDMDKESFVYKEIIGRIYLSIALFHQNNIEEAEATLTEALDICCNDGLVMVFVENSLELIPILESMQETEFSKEVLRRCIECVGNIADERAEKRSLLTSREIEIMELVVIGSKNAEIAEALHIAQVTVEKTLTKVYQKLNVKNRAGAANKYEEIGRNAVNSSSI